MIYNNLGCVPYRDVWAIQEELLAKGVKDKLSGSNVENTVLFVEHPNVYTIGRSGHIENMLLNTLELNNINAELINVNRGGDITYHGPGQIVTYLIIDLDKFNLGIKNYIHLLEESIINTIAEYGIKGERLEGATGVWLDVNTTNERKICAIGVKCSRGVTMHGLALNVNTDLKYFSYINPCGFADKGVTSIEKELGHKEDLNKVIEKIIKHLDRNIANWQSSGNIEI